MPVSPGPQAEFPFDADAARDTPSRDVPRLTEWSPERWPLADDWRAVSFDTATTASVKSHSIVFGTRTIPR